MNGRAQRYREALAARLAWQAGNIGRQLAGKLFEVAQAQRDLQRKEALVSVVAHADIERAHTAADVARQEAEALGQALVPLKA